jgi:two-component system nitrate/nitrite response regulator NarL
MPLRCLIVDDSAAFLGAARVLLERQGVEVVGIASSSADAVERAAELQPDVALVDIDLGGESGFDLARRLSPEGRNQLTRVILVSAHAQEDFAELIDESPAAGFLSKADLSAAAIRELLESDARD